MRISILNQLGTVSDGSEPTTLKGENIPQNQMVCIQRITVRNKTSNDTYVFTRAVSGAGSSYLGMIATSDAPKWYTDSDPIYLRDCQRIELDFYAVNNGDELEAFIYGYYVEC